MAILTMAILTMAILTMVHHAQAARHSGRPPSRKSCSLPPPPPPPPPPPSPLHHRFATAATPCFRWLPPQPAMLCLCVTSSGMTKYLVGDDEVPSTPATAAAAAAASQPQQRSVQRVQRRCPPGTAERPEWRLGMQVGRSGPAEHQHV
eukprot:scaffold76048_cov70-Phaeocystis_antarctica.AAC.5